MLHGTGETWQEILERVDKDHDGVCVCVFVRCVLVGKEAPATNNTHTQHSS